MYDIGTVWVMDAVHTPYGCSVWPALFTRESCPVPTSVKQSSYPDKMAKTGQ
jgi:hypothetical protein